MPSNIFAFKIYDGKNLKVKMTALLGSDYSYETSLLLGRSGFELTNSKLELEGHYLKNLNFTLSTDFSEKEIDSGNIKILKDAFIEYKFHIFFKLRAGRFKIPFGKEISLGSSKRPYIYRPESSKKISPGYSDGFVLSGKKIFSLFQYKMGFFNSSGSLSQKNITGHHLFISSLSFKKEFFSAGYSFLLETNETLSHGAFIHYNKIFTNRLKLRIFIEFLEKRHYNYHWNHSFFSFSSLRFKSAEPVIYFNYFNHKVSYDGSEDKWTGGLGFNYYFLKDKLRLMLDIHTNYHPSLEDGYNLKFYNSKITLKLLLVLK